MASNRKYAYYLRGNQIALIEEGLGSGVCSLSGYSNQTTCEAAGGTWTENVTGSDDGLYSSPAATVAAGLEIEYAYSPKYQLPTITSHGSMPITQVNRVFMDGWIAADGYLTFCKAKTDLTGFSKIAVDSSIYVGGSSRWTGIHKVKAVQQPGDVMHGGIQTYTRASGAALQDNGVLWQTDDNQISGFTPFSITETLGTPDDTPYIWIMGSTEARDTNWGLFSEWQPKDDGFDFTLDFATTKQHFWQSFHPDGGGIFDSGRTTRAAAMEDDTGGIYVYPFNLEVGSYIVADVDVLDSESDTIDVPDYLSKALVYYVKARIAEDTGQMDGREYFMREFKIMLEKHESARIWGPRMVSSGPFAIK